MNIDATLVTSIRTTVGPAVTARPSWVDEFVRSSDWIAHGRYAELRSLLRDGHLLSAGHGVFRWASSAVEAQARGEHPQDDACRARVRAALLIAPAWAVVSHEAAALLHGMKSLAPWPARVIVTVPSGASSHSSRWLVRHAHDLGETVAMDGMTVTSPARTAADAARTVGRETAFELLCTALFASSARDPRTSIAAVQHELDALGSARGVRAARALLPLATTGCESPAEARSLLHMFDLGYARPQQQADFRDREGRMLVDFFWPEAGLVGECDGLVKYLSVDRGDGRGAARAVIDEKLREDRLRALGLRVVRWTPATLQDRGAFDRLLATAGTPRLRG